MSKRNKLIAIILAFFLICFSFTSAMAAKVCLSWDWQETSNPSLSDIVQFKIYYSEFSGLPFLGTFVNQGPSPFVAAAPNTNGSSWSSCFEMLTAINSYYTITAYIPNLGEGPPSNVVYVDFSLPFQNSDKVPFGIQWLN